jgi:hypothetical protein
MASHYTDPETQLMFFVRGGRAKFSVHTQQKNELEPEMLPCLEIRGLMLRVFSQ